VLDHRSLPLVFESRRVHIWRLFRLWLRLIIFGGHSAHLAYLVHKSDCKIPIIKSSAQHRTICSKLVQSNQPSKLPHRSQSPQSISSLSKQPSKSPHHLQLSWSKLPLQPPQIKSKLTEVKFPVRMPVIIINIFDIY
jgi:hypothetical protein